MPLSTTSADFARTRSLTGLSASNRSAQCQCRVCYLVTVFLLYSEVANYNWMIPLLGTSSSEGRPHQSETHRGGPPPLKQQTPVVCAALWLMLCGLCA